MRARLNRDEIGRFFTEGRSAVYDYDYWCFVAKLNHTLFLPESKELIFKM